MVPRNGAFPRAAFVSLSIVALSAFGEPAIVGGTVKEASADGSLLTVIVGSGAAPKKQEFRVTAGTKVMLDGKVAKISDFGEGTRVTLVYDKVTSEVTNIRAATPKPPEESSAETREAPSTQSAPKPPSVRPATGSTRTDRATGEWPQWRGPNRDGVSKETGLLTEWPEGGPKLLWKATGFGKAYSSVVISGGRLFTMGNVSGKESVVAAKLEDGSVLWTSPVGGGTPNSTPTVEGGQVFALGQQGDFVCVDAASGEERWRKHFGRDFGGRMMSGWGCSESPLVDGVKLICAPGGDQAALVALNKKTGEPIWKAAIPGCGGASYASPVIAEVGGIRQYITLFGRCIAGVAAKDGSLLWQYNRVANGTANAPTPIVKGDLVFCSTGYGTGGALLKLVPTDGTVKAEEQYFLPGNEFQNHHGGMVLVGDHVYAGHGHNNGFPTCLELKTGKVAWGKQRGPGSGSAAVVYADGHVYFRYDNGVMALIEATPDGYKLKSSFNQPDRTRDPAWAHPVVADGRLYLRDGDILLCYDVRGQ